MLHIIFEETRNVFPVENKAAAHDWNVIVFDGAASIQSQFAFMFENISLHGKNLLRTGLVTRYLKELWDVEWYDDYTFILSEEEERVRVTPTYLSYDLQLCILLLYHSEKGNKVRLTSFIPYIENLAWVSKNCEMTVYINVEAANPVFGGGERTEAAGEEAGIFDFVWAGQHYGCSWNTFVMDVLEGYFDTLRKLDKPSEQYYFQGWQKNRQLKHGEPVLLKDLLAREQDGLANSAEPYFNLIVKDYGCSFCSVYKYYDLFVLLKKEDVVYLYEDVSVKYPTLWELLLYHCLQVNRYTEEFSITKETDVYGMEDLAKWADEVVLFVTDRQQCDNVINFYDSYGACIHYEKRNGVVSILAEEQGILLFHGLYQEAVPLETLRGM